MPPKVSKQKPTNKHRKPRRKTGGLLDRAVPVSELRRPRYKILLYGPNRAGKTYLACSFTKPLLLLNFEHGEAGGAGSVRDFEDVTFLSLRSTEECLALAEEVTESKEFATVVVDSATSLQDLILKELMELDELPVQLGWGTVSTDIYRQRSEKTKEILRRFIDIPADIIVTGKEKDHNPPQRNEEGGLDMRPKMVKPLQMESFIAVDVGGATAGWLHDVCDYIFRLYKDEEMEEKVVTVGDKQKTTYKPTGKYIRHLLVDYHPTYAGGCRLGIKRDAMPEEGIITDPTFKKLKQLLDD